MGRSRFGPLAGKDFFEFGEITGSRLRVNMETFMEEANNRLALFNPYCALVG
jgi:hypothetical protein